MEKYKTRADFKMKSFEQLDKRLQSFSLRLCSMKIWDNINVPNCLTPDLINPQLD